MSNLSEPLLKYDLKLKTKENNEMNISIGYIDSKLSITAVFYKNYFKKTFSNSFTLEKLKESSSYYKQFNNEKEVINEILNNKLKGEEKIEGNEETSNAINLEIPLPSTNFSKISFELKQVNKTPEEILNEYKYIINQYENKFQISNFKSKILAGKDLEKETIKIWISPKKKLEASLLFSFHDIEYKEDSKSKYTYSLDSNINVRNFHKSCDNKSKILVICKSKNEIFGGYTPLSFNSSDEYGKDNDSFLFSLNQLKKYPKNNYEKTESLWCYKNYGPSFHWDLYFREKKMHAVKFEKKTYLTPEKWIDKYNCYVNDEGILLDSLEIFQIIDISDDSYCKKSLANLFGTPNFKNEKKNSSNLIGNNSKNEKGNIKNDKKDIIEEEKLDEQIIKNEENKNIINENDNSKNENNVVESKKDTVENKNDSDENKNDIKENENKNEENINNNK